VSVTTIGQMWSRACFRVSSDRLGATDITGLLGLEPSSARDKGTRVADRSDAYVLPAAVWSLDSGLTSDDSLDLHISALLDILEVRADAVRALCDRGCTVEFFAGFGSENGQGGFVLDAQLLGQTAALGIDLTLDLYPPG
jgi:hypothetical protein